MKKTADEVCVPQTSISLLSSKAWVDLCNLCWRGNRRLGVRLVMTRQKLGDFGAVCLCFRISGTERTGRLIFPSLIISVVQHVDGYHHLHNCSGNEDQIKTE